MIIRDGPNTSYRPAVVGDGAGVTALFSERPLRIIAEVAPRPYVIAVRRKSNAALADMITRGLVKQAADTTKFPYQAP